MVVVFAGFSGGGGCTALAVAPVISSFRRDLNDVGCGIFAVNQKQFVIP